MKLKCPNCATESLAVVETRQTSEIVYRTRKCSSCGWNFTTTETFAENGIPNTIRKPKKYELEICPT